MYKVYNFECYKGSTSSLPRLLALCEALGISQILFSCETSQIIPSGQDSVILAVSVANHSAGYGSSCPLTELSCICGENVYKYYIELMYQTEYVCVGNTLNTLKAVFLLDYEREISITQRNRRLIMKLL